MGIKEIIAFMSSINRFIWLYGMNNNEQGVNRYVKRASGIWDPNQC